jgi:23S rRNA pseudouridine1911/1915/1917 synthase
MNQGFEYEEQIGAGGDARTVLGYLADRYRHSSEAVWRARLGSGEVLLDGVLARAEDILRRGQSLRWRRPAWEEPAVPLAFAVLHADQDLLVVAKPRGLPTVPAGGFLTHTLLALVRSSYPEATPVHRLGRGTSGLVLFARTPRARAALAAAWRERQVAKVYRALLEGVPDRDRFRIEAPIRPVPHGLLGQVYAASDRGKPARSDVRILERRPGTALAEVEIETGRPHQIRIHLAAAGYPLRGDPLYMPGGAPRDNVLPGATGYRLHALRLALRHPATGEPFAVECPAPPELRVTPGGLEAGSTVPDGTP